MNEDNEQPTSDQLADKQPAIQLVTRTAFTVKGELIDTIELYYAIQRLGDGKYIHTANGILGMFQNTATLLNRDGKTSTDPNLLLRYYRRLRAILAQ